MKPYNIYTHKHNKNKTMNINEVRSIIRQVIAEAMEDKKNGLPRSSGKLVELKKEMDGLKRMKESLGQLQISEGGDQQFVAEYAHMQKFVNEFNKLKEAHARLSEMLDTQISNVDERIKTETDKIKEMMGLIEKAKKEPKEKKEKKTAHEKGESKAEEKEEHKPKADDKKKNKKLDEAVFSSNDVNAILKAAKIAVEAGKEVTVDGVKIGKVVPPAGAFIPADGSKPYPRIKDYYDNMSAIVIDGVPAELKAMEPKPFSGGSKNMSHDDWADRFGPGGGVDTAFGRYTGD